MEKKPRLNLIKLLAFMMIAGMLSSCTLIYGPPEATSIPTSQPATAVPLKPSSTPPIVVVISPTPVAPEPTLNSSPGEVFCSDARVQAVIDSLQAAIIDRDGTALAAVADPVNGLDIYYRLANATVHVAPDEIAGLFNSDMVYTWGEQAGSGLPIEGTFSAEILPGLLDVFERSYTASCQDLSTGVGTGPTTALVDWPADFGGMPYVALFRAPGAGDNELDWRTWAVGFTVVNGQPKIRVLVQYVWEI